MKARKLLLVSLAAFAAVMLPSRGPRAPRQGLDQLRTHDHGTGWWNADRDGQPG